jgi:hypothetical protein
MRWTTGDQTIERLLQEGRIERVQGARADGTAWLERARRTVSAAGLIAGTNPDSAFALAYDSARQACTGLLVQQGLRPTTAGGHYCVEEACRAQFGDHLRGFGALRRRRNELEYPQYPTEEADTNEAQHAIDGAQTIIDSAEKLLPNLDFF